MWACVGAQPCLLDEIIDAGQHQGDALQFVTQNHYYHQAAEFVASLPAFVISFFHLMNSWPGHLQKSNLLDKGSKYDKGLRADRLREMRKRRKHVEQQGLLLEVKKEAGKDGRKQTKRVKEEGKKTEKTWQKNPRFWMRARFHEGTLYRLMTGRVALTKCLATGVVFTCDEGQKDKETERSMYYR